MKAPIENADFGRTADDYLTHRAGFPESLFTRLEGQADRFTGKRVLDLGTGTGTLARGLAAMGNQVTGLDPSPAMLDAAAKMTPEALDISWVVGHAEGTGCSDSSFDVVSAGQCWHWFDPVAACDEIARVLTPNGQVLIAYYDWLPMGDNMVRRTEELIEQYNPAWLGGNGHGIHPGCFTDLALGGFSDLASYTYDEPAIYTHEGWRGRIRASAGISATLSEEEVQSFDAELQQLLAKDYPDEPLAVPHRVFVLTATLNC